MPEGQKADGIMNIVTKTNPVLRKPPEVPALVIAARERAG